MFFSKRPMAPFCGSRAYSKGHHPACPGRWRLVSRSVIAGVVLVIVLYRVVSSFLQKYYDDMAKARPNLWIGHHWISSLDFSKVKGLSPTLWWFWKTKTSFGFQERSTIEKALQATQELSFPMVLLKVRQGSPCDNLNRSWDIAEVVANMKSEDLGSWCNSEFSDIWGFTTSILKCSVSGGDLQETWQICCVRRYFEREHLATYDPGARQLRKNASADARISDVFLVRDRLDQICCFNLCLSLESLAWQDIDNFLTKDYTTVVMEASS